MMQPARILATVGAVLVVIVIPARAAPPVPPLPVGATPPTVPHVGFYTVHPRVGLSTYFSLSASWPHTQLPLRVVAKVHPVGETCGATPASDSGSVLASAWLSRDNHHTVWKEWTPATSGSFTVCTWLGDPAIATGTGSLVIEPRTDGVTAAGTLVAAKTGKTPFGPARAVFPTAPRRVYAHFALRGVPQGTPITIEFRDTNGRVVLTRVRSDGPRLTWYSAHIERKRLAARLGYWLVSVRVGAVTLGRIHFLIPNYTRTP